MYKHVFRTHRVADMFVIRRAIKSEQISYVQKKHEKSLDFLKKVGEKVFLFAAKSPYNQGNAFYIRLKSFNLINFPKLERIEIKARKVFQ